MKNKSILYILCPLYIWPINCYSNYNINDMGDSIYNPLALQIMQVNIMNLIIIDMNTLNISTAVS